MDGKLPAYNLDRHPSPLASKAKFSDKVGSSDQGDNLDKKAIHICNKSVSLNK
uniref:Uncharacterized protein n=1 Tax=Rhizophora mucronata TaxID=61149 RepID=A0A2P2IXN9_RHIMU